MRYVAFDLLTDQHPLEARSHISECPPEQAFEPEVLSPQRPKVVGVLGSSGTRASWQAGVAEAMVEKLDVIRWDLASGGCVPGLAVAAGIDASTRRAMNAGVPSRKMLSNLEALPYFERKGLDFAGRMSSRGLEVWLSHWLRWAGIESWNDFRYKPDDERPRDAEFRVGISVVMWEAGVGRRSYSPAELRDPAIVHAEFRNQFLNLNLPIRKCRQIWIPDSIDEHLPWMKDEILASNPAEWAAVSCNQWPVVLPRLAQNPQTGRMIFLADGGHLTNQPSRFNDGRLYYGEHMRDYPLVNPRLSKFALLPGDRKRQRGNASMPGGYVMHFDTDACTRVSILKLNTLSPELRDAQYQRGLRQGRAAVAEVAEQIQEWGPRFLDTTNVTVEGDASASRVTVDPGEQLREYTISLGRLHAFRLLAGADFESQGIRVRHDVGWHG